MSACPDFLHDSTLDARIKALPKIAIGDLLAAENSIEEDTKQARAFYDTHMNNINIHSDAVPHAAREYRNCLIKAGKWTSDDQVFYNIIKIDYAEYISNLTDFEKGEL